MQDLDQIQEIPQPPQPMWYQTRAGKTFLGILIATLILVLGFFTLTGYYIWQIKFGSGKEKLAQEFNPQFTVDPSQTNSTPSNTTVEDLTKIIYPTTPILGSTKAPLTIFAFIDFECPFSQSNYPVFKEIIQRYAPIARIIFKHMPISSIHEQAMQAHLASTCAQEQGKFWEYYDLLLTNKKLESAVLTDYANKLKLDMNKFNRCLDSKKYQNNIDQDLIDAANLGIRGTPTYFINQTKVEGATTKENFDKIILENMQKSL